MVLDWKWTRKKEYPEQGQVCLVYFHFTKYTISEYSVEHDDEMGYSYHCFSDAAGFLGNEDVLWIPVKDLPPFGSYKYITIPDEYTKYFEEEEAHEGK